MERREEEFARLKAQIEERKRARPLLERVIETPTAVFLTAGVIIGAVICAITNALKNTGKSLENCLGELCKKKKKTAAILPGVICSMVSFRVKAAGQAIRFLAENTWLLILSVVAFLIEKKLSKSGVNTLQGLITKHLCQPNRR